VVFAIAVRYHKAAAYSTGLLGAIVYTLLLWQQDQLSLSLAMLHRLLEPFLLVLCSVVASDMLHAQRRRLMLAEQKQVRTEELLNKTIRQYQTALSINAELERQIAGQTTSVITISDKMTQVWQPDGTKRYNAILDMIAHAIEAQACSLYLNHHGRMILYTYHPVGASEPPSVLNLKDPLIRQVIRQRKVITVRDLLTEQTPVLQKTAYMAGPLIDRKGQVLGIVIIDKIALLKFTPNAVRLFATMLHMASVALQTASPELERAWNEYLRWVDENMTHHSVRVVKEQREG
jgi:K+-sensing histidine kinase KdpD